MGAIYLSKANEIGAFIFHEHGGHDSGSQAIEALMAKHQGERFLANINPHNHHSIHIFEELGFKHIQNTYELRSG
jgi:RimJ/RimL family protein N-acetyltransferase